MPPVLVDRNNSSIDNQQNTIMPRPPVSAAKAIIPSFAACTRASQPQAAIRSFATRQCMASIIKNDRGVRTQVVRASNIAAQERPFSESRRTSYKTVQEQRSRYKSGVCLAQLLTSLHTKHNSHPQCGHITNALPLAILLESWPTLPQLRHCSYILLPLRKITPRTPPYRRSRQRRWPSQSRRRFHPRRPKQHPLHRVQPPWKIQPRLLRLHALSGHLSRGARQDGYDDRSG